MQLDHRCCQHPGPQPGAGQEAPMWQLRPEKLCPTWPIGVSQAAHLGRWPAQRTPRGASSRAQGLSLGAGSPRTVTASSRSTALRLGATGLLRLRGHSSGPTGQEPADQRPRRSRCAASARVDTTAGRWREVLSGQLHSVLLPGVPLPVANEAGAVGEGFPTFLALVGLLSSVSFLMF